MDQPALKPLSGLQVAPLASLAWLRGRRFWILPLGVLVILVLLVDIQANTSGVLHLMITDITPSIALIFAACGAFWLSLRLPDGRDRWAWRLIGLAFFSYMVAEVIETVLDLSGNDLAPPSPAALFLVAFYPLLITGLLMLPSSALGRSARGRLLVDVGTATCATLGLSFLTIIAPLLTGRGVDESLLEKVLLVVYPLGDVALIATLILLLLRATESALRPILLWMALGIGMFIYADTALNILGLQDIYETGLPFVHPFTIAGELLMGLSAWFYLIHGSDAGPGWKWLTQTRETPSLDVWKQRFQQYILPYFPLPLLGAFIVARELLPPSEIDAAYILEALALIIVLLMITRQLLLSSDLVDARVANERALQLDALKDQFITSVNHELRTPLMTMQTYIELLRYQQQALPGKSGRLVEEIGRTNDALVDLVQSILEVRRIDQKNEDFPREAVNVRRALEQATALINPREGRISERILRVDVSPNLAVWGEAVRVQQILTNLLSNAIKYSDVESAIEVSAAVAQAESGKRSRSGKQRPMVQITIRDYGLGIPSDQVPLLFHRFVRLPRDLASNVVGSGLGLYLCQNLTEALGGQIWVESEGIAGQGSTFHILLPYAEAVADREMVAGGVAVHANR